MFQLMFVDCVHWSDGGCRHFCGRAWLRVWSAVRGVWRRDGNETRNLAAAQSGTVRLQGATPSPGAGQVRRQSGPPRVRTRLSNQETQILMTTINGPTSAAADDIVADE